MLTRLSGADALSLHSQSQDVPGHTVTFVILKPAEELSHRRLHQVLAASLPQLALFRSRLVAKPMGMGQPVWAEVDAFDPAPQIHSATLPAPGGQAEFAEFIADLSSGVRQRDQPLWEAWSIDGLADGRWAVALTISPALNDGAAGAASVWPRLLTEGPDDIAANNLPIEPSIGGSLSVAEMATDLLSEIVENQFAGMYLIGQALSTAVRTARDRLLDNGSRPHTTVSGPIPRMVFNERLTRRRAVAFSSISLHDVRTVSSAFGGSITNVVLAAITMSLRAWLTKYDTVPDHPMLMRMPFELPGADSAKIGRALTIGRFRVPVHLDDPVQILANLHTATERLNVIRRERVESSSPTTDADVIGSLIPPTVARIGMELYRRSRVHSQLAPSSHGAVSYTAVTPSPAYCAGAEVVSISTVAPLTDGCGLSLALTARGDTLEVGACACPDNVPAIGDIAAGVALAVDTLVAAAVQSPRGRGRSVVTEMTSHPANRPGRASR